ncbi:ATP-dependent zinc metalloprotease FTSH, chloroplastic-like [Hordeum vulgare]|nr:ATP-dependent zinc metalloprotease FTSH, chloroplastic-like [Hordeum vulgare]
MAPDVVVLALSFARPSHQPDPEHLNRIHPSRRARDPRSPCQPAAVRSLCRRALLVVAHEGTRLQPPLARPRLGWRFASPQPPSPQMSIMDTMMFITFLESNTWLWFASLGNVSFEYVLHGWKAVLEDPDDDVRVVAVDTLIPAAASLVRLNDQMLNSVAMSLWDILLDLNDISPCTKVGHALVGSLMAEYDPVAKISIIPRGQAGGLTFCAPSEERLESRLYNRSYLENQMVVALGGRVAKEVIFGQGNVTTRASSDFMHVSRVARQMVERFGLMYPFW